MPTSEWALLLPAYSIVLVLLTYCAYFALALSGTPDFSDVSAVTGARDQFADMKLTEAVMLTTVGIAPHADSRAHLPDVDAASSNPYLAHARPDAIPIMYDIPIGLVNRVVYSQRPGGARSVPPVGLARDADPTI